MFHPARGLRQDQETDQPTHSRGLSRRCTYIWPSSVVVHADLATLCGDGCGAEIEDGPVIHPETARRLACDARLEMVLHDTDGAAVGIGWASRNVPPWLVRQLRHRDGGCVLPGCEARRFLHAHHIVLWPVGPTDLYNRGARVPVSPQARTRTPLEGGVGTRWERHLEAARRTHLRSRTAGTRGRGRARPAAREGGVNEGSRGGRDLDTQTKRLSFRVRRSTSTMVKRHGLGCPLARQAPLSRPAWLCYV